MALRVSHTPERCLENTASNGSKRSTCAREAINVKARVRFEELRAPSLNTYEIKYVSNVVIMVARNNALETQMDRNTRKENFVFKLVDVL